jgi:hypothetical protein
MCDAYGAFCNMMRTSMKTRLVLTGLLALAATAIFAAEGDGYSALFNGKDTTGWHLRRKDGPNSWRVTGGILENIVGKGEHGTDLVTDKTFWNFVVKYEFMVPDGSNSGVYLRGRYELQILGDFQSGKASGTGNGAIYNFRAPSEFASKPGDQWQTVEATIIGNRITVVLNGITVHSDVECDRTTGGEIDVRVNDPGPIVLQGDHGTVSFRNLRIKELP